MIPPGALFGLIVALTRATKTSGKGAPPPSFDWQLARPIAVFALMGYFLLAPALIVALDRPPIGLVLLFLLSPLMFPWAFTRWCLIPLGLPGPARMLTLWAGLAWSGDRFGGSIAAGAWAELRRAEPDPHWIDAQEPQLKKSSLRAGGILAHGLAAAGRGDLASARSLLASVGELHDIYSPTLARKLAREWLMVDALERGAWDELHALATEPGSRTRLARILHAVSRRVAREWRTADAHERGASDEVPASRSRPGPRTRLSRFLHGVAACKTGHPYRFARPRLFFWWLLSGHWSALRPLYLEASVPADRACAVAPAPRPEPSLAAVLAMHARAMETAPAALTVDLLTALGETWDSVLQDPAQLAHMDTRAAALGLPSADGIAARIRTSVVDDMVAMLAPASLPVDSWRGREGVLAAVASRLRDTRLAHLEEIAGHLHRRVKAGTELAPIDEWREFLHVREACDSAIALGGLEVRRLVFSQAYSAVSAHSTWLYNKRDEKPIAHAMILWMLAEARAAGDEEATALQTKNAALIPDWATSPPTGSR